MVLSGVKPRASGTLAPTFWMGQLRHYISGVEGVVELESQCTARKREQLGLMLEIVHRAEPQRVSPDFGETGRGMFIHDCASPDAAPILFQNVGASVPPVRGLTAPLRST